RAESSGYALLVVLMVLSLVLIISAAFLVSVKKESQQAILCAAEIEAVQAADGGLRYGLEAVRNNKSLKSSYASESWSRLDGGNGISSCFKVFVTGSPDQSHLVIRSVGEIVNGPCSESPDATDALL